MNIILLSGGSGQRLWPLSNDIRSKQFIKIFKGNDGNYESIVDGFERNVNVGDVIYMNAGSKHTIINNSGDELKIIEVQIGSDISVHDKYKNNLN